MADVDVVKQATDYLRLMSELTPASEFYFRSFASDGVAGLPELCDAAYRVAAGGETALASLVVAPGPESAFTMDGAHARATLRLCPTPHTRLLVIGIVLALAVVAMMVFGRRK